MSLWVKSDRLCEISRNKWKFWQIEKVCFNLSSQFQNAYKEVEKKTWSGRELYYQLKDWVVEDIRHQLKWLVTTHYPEVCKVSKTFEVRFKTELDTLDTTTKIPFYYIDGEILFDFDYLVKRSKILDKILD
jgi:hypothetical protein